MPKPIEIHLKPSREKPVLHRHPWLFSGAIERIAGAPAPGDIVRVLDANGEFLAHAYFNAQSQITLRLLSWDKGETIDTQWWRRQINESIIRRGPLLASAETDCCRLVHAEADGLPGLIVDRYADFLVCQFLTAGIEQARATILDALWDNLKPTGILDLSDNDIRKFEGLSECGGALRGNAPEEPVTIRENGLRYHVDLRTGQKTGFYLDQRRNRQHVAKLALGRRVLDCFCYTGGFTVHCLAAGAQTVAAIDSSASSLELLKSNVGLLGGDHLGSVETLGANVFEALRKFRDQGRQFDMVILDPPKLAATQAQVNRAMRAYKDLNLLAMKLLTPDGILVTFSCSGAVSAAAFQETVAWAATDAHRRVQIIEKLSQGEDHPVLVSFPESEYLKGLICRVL